MTNPCPKCRNRVTELAIACDLCGRTFDTTLEEAMALIDQEDYPAALAMLNQAIVVAPAQRLSECYGMRGFAQLKHLDFVRAEEDCTESIGLNWEQAQTYAWRAAARGEQNKWKSAFDDLDRACELSEPISDQYLQLMESYAVTASEYFREQITTGKESADLFFERGWIYFRCGNYQKAERDFQQAIRIQPRHPWASVGLAELLLHQHESAGVRELCTAGNEGDIACRRRALEIRAELNHNAGNFSLAKQDLDQLANLAEDDAQELIRCARLRSRLGNHVAAIDQLNRILDEFPDQHSALLVRGDCFQEIKNYSLAINDYTRYLQICPDHVPALVNRGKMFLATKRLTAAREDLQQALAIDETDFEAHLNLSRVEVEENRLDAALNQCQLAVRIDNQQPDAFAVLATIYSRLGDFRNAIEEYGRSIELAGNPDDESHYRYLRGIAHYELGDFEPALHDFKKACHDRPNHAGSWIWNAATCARREAWADAILGLQQAILVRPSAAQQYQQLGRPVAEKAIGYFDRQQQRGDSKPELFRNRGLAKQFIGHHKAAVKDFSAALQIVPGDTETLIRRGQVYTQLGELEAAIKDFTQLLQKDHANHRAHYGRAIAYLAADQFAAAKTDLQLAIETAPEHPRYHHLLGELFQRIGDDGEAMNAFGRAILLDPTNPVSYRHRGMTHLASNRYLQAIGDFTRSLELNPTQFELLVQRGQTYVKTNQLHMALEDFELALTHNDRLAHAYSGRATVLVTQGRLEYALIWLTKAIHRFTDPREIAEIVFARGKVFYQMGRNSPAIADFSTVINLLLDDQKIVAAARYARAIAEVHDHQYEAAGRDFRRLLALDPDNERFRAGLKWLAQRDQPRPSFLQSSMEMKRPTRPSVVRNGVTLSDETLEKWKNDPPQNSWIVRTDDRKEYGPIPLAILETWASEGRLDIGMKVLRSDWSKWKRVEKILPEITPLESIVGLVDEFPELNLKPARVRQHSEKDS